MENSKNHEKHERPTSDWEYSHALEEGDELETENGEVWRVTTVQSDGGIRVRRIDDDRTGPNDRDTWPEDAVRTSLAHQEIKRVRDGLSHELASY